MQENTNSQTVVVLGASAKPQRFSYKAVGLLRQYGHRIIPVHPKLPLIDDIPVFSQLSEIQEIVDTLTLYIGPERSQLLHDDIIDLAPRRVIFNPGTESPSLEQRLTEVDIPFVYDCTLIMLQSEQFHF